VVSVPLELPLVECPDWLFIPLVVAGIAYQLSHRRSYAFIAALFAAADGLFLVESRYALNNVYLVIFGAVVLLLALESHGRRRGFWLFCLCFVPQLPLSGMACGFCWVHI